MPKYNAGSRRRKTQRIMRAFKINEISAVDRPAQEGARAVIMKRDGGSQTEFEKRVWLTTSTEGHAHLVDEQDYEGIVQEGGSTSWTQSEGEDSGHSHPWVRDREGTVTIGDADGHTHETIETLKLAPGAKTYTPEDPMPKKNDDNTANKDAEAAEAAEALKASEDRNTELTTQLAEATARAEMTDAQKAHFDALDPSLDDDARKAFVEAKPAAREVIVAKAKSDADDAKGIAYTADDGTIYTKADDPRLTSGAKRNDELARDLSKALKRTEEQDLRKRVEDDLAHMPGTVETRMAMLKAVDAIENDDDRKAAVDSLKAQNEQMSKAFKTLGSSTISGETQGGDQTADDKLDVLAKAHAKENKVSEAQGYDAVLRTEEGAALYAESTGDSQPVH
jgi:hypothetical protein